jgi:hypothetical protein
MKLGVKIACLFLTGFAGLMGCGKNPPPSAESVAETEFKAHLQLLQRNTTNDLVAPITYDIRKTDSLVSPFMGQIEWAEADNRHQEPNFGEVWSGWAHRLTLAYQDHKWVLKKAESKFIMSPNLHQTEPDWFGSGAERAYAVALGVPAK